MTWKSYKRTYIQRHHPIICAVCGTFRLIDLHHIIPRSVDSSLEFVDSNIVPLCRLHHFIFGHRSNWSQTNPNVLQDIQHAKSFTFQNLN